MSRPCPGRWPPVSAGVVSLSRVCLRQGESPARELLAVPATLLPERVAGDPPQRSRPLPGGERIRRQGRRETSEPGHVGRRRGLRHTSVEGRASPGGTGSAPLTAAAGMVMPRGGGGDHADPVVVHDLCFGPRIASPAARKNPPGSLVTFAARFETGEETVVDAHATSIGSPRRSCSRRWPGSPRDRRGSYRSERPDRRRHPPHGVAAGAAPSGRSAGRSTVSSTRRPVRRARTDAAGRVPALPLPPPRNPVTPGGG